MKTPRKVAVALVSLTCVLMFAQSPRDSYRAAYANWRQADPNLERDSALPQAGFPARVEKVATAAAEYGKARAAFLRSFSGPELGPLAGPFNLEVELLANRDLRTFTTAEAKTVEVNIKRFEKDKDRGIVQWRQALEREHAALADLETSIAARQADTAKAAAALATAETSRALMESENAQFHAAIQQAADVVDQEAAGWAEYYRKLALVGAAAISRAPEGGRAPESARLPDARPAASSSPAPAKAVPPIPLIRYTGTWSFPPTAGMFSGAKPEFVDLAVHEEAGQLKGSFYGRFTPPPGSNTDPVVRFDFSGPLTSNRTQTLALETPDGAKGNIDLIPGGAFNLLEVNFHTDPKPGKLQQGNMVLLKK